MASPPTTPNAADDANPASDGSMEDILASIRRILAEDGGQGGPAPAAAPPQGEDVLDLTEQMLAPAPAEPASASASGMSAADIDALFNASPPPSASAVPQQEPAMADPPDQQKPMSTSDIDALFDAPTPAPPPAPPPVAVAPAPPPPPMPMAEPAAATGEGLVGGAVAAAAAASFAALRAASRGSDADARALMPDTLLGNGAVTLEQVVREELRPLLKSWLDTNLPPLVERLVRAELERVARG